MEKRTQSLFKQGILGLNEDEELSIISGCVRRFRSSITSSEPFRWLSDRVSAAARLTTGLTSTKIYDAYTTFKLNSQKQVSIMLDLHWDPSGFLQDYHGKTGRYGLANVLTLNGDAETCQMLKCGCVLSEMTQTHISAASLWESHD